MKKISKFKIIFIIFLTFIFILLLINLNDKSQFTIVIDPGHGGKLSADKGATGIDNITKEYELNDIVCLKLANALKKEGYNILFTRKPYVNENEMTLTQRTQITNIINPDLFISIHHNSTSQKAPKKGYSIYYSSYKANLDNKDLYVQEGNKKYIFLKEKIVNSVTTVYYSDGIKTYTSTGRSNVTVKDKSMCKVAKKGFKLANILNEQLYELNYISPLNDKDSSVIDNNFRVLRMTNCPSVLIECGYMSNEEELNDIKNENNQDKLVKQIVKGINKFF